MRDEVDEEYLPFDIEWRKWRKRGVSATRIGLELYMAAKTRSPAMLGMAIASAAESADEWSKKSNPSLDKRLRKIDLLPLYSDTQIMRFLQQICKQLALPHHKMALGSEDEDSSDIVYVYELGADEKIYFVYKNTWLEFVYGKDADTLIDSLSKAVKQNMGRYITLTVAVEGWNTSAGLIPSKVHLDGYVSPVSTQQFCDSILKFQAKGLNRSSLLLGPPGTGKTTFAAEVARQMDGRLLVIEAAPLNRIMRSGIQLEQLIDIVGPTVILFDDLDRVNNLDEMYGEVERLNRLTKRQELLILGSINHLNKLPEPLQRPGRFDEIVIFPLPDADLRRRILKAHLDRNGVKIGRASDMDRLVTDSETLSGAHLREIADQLSIRNISEIWARIEFTKKMKALGAEDDDEDGDEGGLLDEIDNLGLPD